MFNKKVRKKLSTDKLFNKNPNWKGGVFYSGGYIRIYVSPYKYEFQHRLIIESFIGRKLKPDEFIHHINGNKYDNRVENLLIVSNKEHGTIHKDTLIRARLKSPVGKLGYRKGELAGINNPMYGKTHSAEAREKIKKANIGRKLSDEIKQKVSIASKRSVQTRKRDKKGRLL